MLFQSSRLIKEPVSSIIHAVTSIARSCVFLTSYTSLGFLTADLVFSTLPKPLSTYLEQNLSPVLASLLCGAFPGCGTAIFLEKPSRRVELVFFVFMHAFQSVYNLLGLRGLLRSSLRARTLHAACMSSVSCALMLHALHQHQSMLRPVYIQLLRFLYMN